MRIKKTSQTTPVQAEVVNTYSESQENAYSCDYINDCNTYAESETFTGKYWIDGKPIYSKTITVTRTSGTSYNVTFDNDGNIDTIIDIRGMAKRNDGYAWGFYRVNDDDQYRYYVSNYSKGQLSITVGNNFPSPTHTAHITMLYTKSSS